MLGRLAAHHYAGVPIKVKPMRYPTRAELLLEARD
jgi:hypothetical protein